jgi:hypothetical protein
MGTDAAEPSMQAKQLAGREPIVEPKVFGQETDLAPYGDIPGWTPENEPLPAGRSCQAQEQADRGALPSAIRPQESENLAAPNLQVQITYGYLAAKGLPEIARFDGELMGRVQAAVLLL